MCLVGGGRSLSHPLLRCSFFKVSSSRYGAVHYQKALDIKLKVLDTDMHPSVSTSYLGIGSVIAS